MKTVKVNVSPEEVMASALQEQTRAEDEARLKGEIQRERDLLQPDGDRDVTSPAEQEGRSLHRSIVISRLQKLNPDLVYEQTKTNHDRGGIYFNGYIEDRLNGTAVYGHWFICGMPHELVREFDLRTAVSAVIPDPTVALHWQEINKADSRERGWRSILLELVKAGLIELEKTKQMFQLNEGRSSRTWQESVN